MADPTILNLSEDPSSDLTKIVYPSNLINDSGSRYGNQFMALYINTDKSPGTPFTGYGNQLPQIKNVNGDKITTATSHTGSVINKFQSAAAGGNPIRNSDQGTVTKYAIYLPIPINLATEFGMQYDDNFDFGTEAAKLAGNVLKGGLKSFNQSIPAMGFGNMILKGLLGGAQAVLDSPLALNAASAYEEIAINPHKQLLFKGVQLRNPEFTYKLIARNADETTTIDYIIRLLRFYMHPDLYGSFLYKYPSEFDIEFFVLKNGVAYHNPYLPFFSTCILKNLSVNYAGGKEFVSHSDGSPVEYEITLKFQETQILNKTVLNAFDSYVNTQGFQITVPEGPIGGYAGKFEEGIKNVFAYIPGSGQ